MQEARDIDAFIANRFGRYVFGAHYLVWCSDDTLGGYLVTKAGHVPVRGELVPGPEPFEAEVLDADPRRVKRVKIYLRKDRRPASPREVTLPPRTAAARPATTQREEPTRSNPNPARGP